MRTDLWNAEVRGEVSTDKGTITFRALAHATEYDDPSEVFAIQQFTPGRRQPVIMVDFALSLTRWLDHNLGNFISNVRPEYRWDSAGLWANSGIDGRAPIELGIESLHPYAVCLPWSCHNYWLQYRYSMDPRLLERLYPLLRRSILWATGPRRTNAC